MKNQRRSFILCDGYKKNSEQTNKQQIEHYFSNHLGLAENKRGKERFYSYLDVEKSIFLFSTLVQPRNCPSKTTTTTITDLIGSVTAVLYLSAGGRGG